MSLFCFLPFVYVCILRHLCFPLVCRSRPLFHPPLSASPRSLVVCVVMNAQTYIRQSKYPDFDRITHLVCMYVCMYVCLVHMYVFDCICAGCA